MKVLMFGWEFPPYINGGLGVACYEIVRALVSQNIQIELILPHTKNSNSAADSSLPTLDIDIQYVNSLLEPYLDEKKFKQLRTEDNLPENYGTDLFTEVYRFAAEASSFAHTIQHDVIHAHDWLTVNAGLQAKAISKKPLFFHVHSLETDRAGDMVNQKIFEIEQEGLEMLNVLVLSQKLVE